MFVPNGELGDFLIDARLLSRADVARLVEEGNLFEIVRMRSLVPEDELLRAVSHILGVPFREIRHEDIDPETLILLPEPISRAHSIAVYKIEGSVAHVALIDLDSLAHAEFLEGERDLRLSPHFTDRASIKRALLSHQKQLKERFAAKLSSESPEEALDALLSHALLSRASDLYIEPNLSGGFSVRYRIEGAVRDAMALSARAQAVAGLLKQSAGLSFTLSLPQEGSFKLKLKNSETVRVGVFSLPTPRGEVLHLHLSPERTGRRGYSLESLGLHGDALVSAHHQLARKSGLVLVAAPQGGGKTTLLYTLLDLASHPHALSVSVEEHAELFLPNATQIEVKKELGQTYASAVRAALKMRPEILMIGELKDEETARLAASAASHGTLVFAGIKAASASKAIQKMLSFDVDPLVLSVSLQAAIGSRVVRKLCPHCKEAYKISRAEIAPLEVHANFARVLSALKAENVVPGETQWKDVEFFRAKGCEKCSGGFEGQTGLYEFLPVSSVARELISDRTREREEREHRLSEVVPLSLFEDGLFKAASGLTTIEEVIEAAGE